MSSNLQFHLYRILTISSLFILFQPLLVSSRCICDKQYKDENSTSQAFTYKAVAMASILVASAIGVCLPLLVKNVSVLHPERAIHFLIKAFAAGVILATGFLHILPDAYDSLKSPCLSENPWGGFPFTGFIAMMSAILTLMMEAFATGYHRRSELRKAQPVNGDDEETDGGQVHGSTVVLDRSNSSDLIRHRVISQVNCEINFPEINT